MRLTLDDNQIVALIDILSSKNDDISKSILQQIDKEIQKPKSSKKQEAIKKALTKKQEIARKKIENAINILLIENKKITIYSVSKKANVSYNTAKKYQDIIKKYSEYNQNKLIFEL